MLPSGNILPYSPRVGTLRREVEVSFQEEKTNGRSKGMDGNNSERRLRVSVQRRAKRRWRKRVGVLCGGQGWEWETARRKSSQFSAIQFSDRAFGAGPGFLALTCQTSQIEA